jgi:hypothetical protein
MSTVNEIKNRLFELIKEKPGTSFAEILRDIPEAKGEYAFTVGKFENLFMWVGLTSESIKALIQLEQENSIKFKPVPLWVYLNDGLILELPIAKKIKNYKKPRWIPAVIELTGK